jgi:hypothetical protein
MSKFEGDSCISVDTCVEQCQYRCVRECEDEVFQVDCKKDVNCTNGRCSEEKCSNFCEKYKDSPCVSYDYCMNECDLCIPDCEDEVFQVDCKKKCKLY